MRDRVIEAARQRAAALAAADRAALLELHHPDLRWTTHDGVVLDRDAYVAGNTGGDLLWRGQDLLEIDVVVAGGVAILCAIVVDQVERDGAAQTFRLRATQTWVEEDGRLRCLAGHAGPRLPA
jgi:ketosteroid isomerase-like protein